MKDITDSNCIVQVHGKQYQVGNEYNGRVLKRICSNGKNIIGKYDTGCIGGNIFEATLDNIFIEYNVPASEEPAKNLDKEVENTSQYKKRKYEELMKKDKRTLVNALIEATDNILLERMGLDSNHYLLGRKITKICDIN